MLLFFALPFAAARLVNLPGVHTPQLGYNSWYDVFMSPSSAALLETASAMATNGLQAAGFKYVNLGTFFPNFLS